MKFRYKLFIGVSEYAGLHGESGSSMASQSSGRQFMTDLLVNSLMADRVLESALGAAIKAEIQEAEELKVTVNT